jgi:hypothetical protein
MLLSSEHFTIGSAACCIACICLLGDRYVRTSTSEVLAGDPVT